MLYEPLGMTVSNDADRNVDRQGRAEARKGPKHEHPSPPGAQDDRELTGEGEADDSASGLKAAIHRGDHVARGYGSTR